MINPNNIYKVKQVDEYDFIYTGVDITPLDYKMIEIEKDLFNLEVYDKDTCKHEYFYIKYYKETNENSYKCAICNSTINRDMFIGPIINKEDFNNMNLFNNKLKKLDELVEIRKEDKSKWSFCNGVYDLIHAGHVYNLERASELGGDKLILAINSDSSVKKIKGNSRPILPDTERAFILSKFHFIDYIHIFNEPNPVHIIKSIIPEFIIKGSDYTFDKLLEEERQLIKEYNIEFRTTGFIQGISTTNIIQKVVESYGGNNK